ncbi:MAG: DUF2269 family protein [Deltaproteobacteria bacterium]|nr:DUF2269 family protein [Deltaproteobacteria bacterium]
MSYPLLKLFHLVSAILWIGPALGAYAFLVAAHRDPTMADRLEWIETTCERVLRVEHVAFIGLVISGFLLMAIGGWSAESPWLFKKLLLFVFVFAFEGFDVWVSHVALPRALSKDSEARARADALRLVVAKAGVVVGGLLVPAILWLAVVKS